MTPCLALQASAAEVGQGVSCYAAQQLLSWLDTIIRWLLWMQIILAWLGHCNCCYVLHCSLHHAPCEYAAASGSRPDVLIWIKQALVVKGEEKKNAEELGKAKSEILDKMTSNWNVEVYGPCTYMFAFAVAGYMLEIYAVQ